MTGTTFWNRIQVTPLRDAKSNQISFFVGMQYEVAGPHPSLPSNLAAGTTLLSLTALSADRMGVVMGRCNNNSNNNNNNNNNNNHYHNPSYNNAVSYSDAQPHIQLPPQIRGPSHYGIMNGNNGGNGGGGITSSGNYGMMGFAQQSFADDRSSNEGTSLSHLHICPFSII